MSVLDVALPHEEPWRVRKHSLVAIPHRHLVPLGTAHSLCGLDGGGWGWVASDGIDPVCGTCERLYYAAVQAAIMDDGDEEP